MRLPTYLVDKANGTESTLASTGARGNGGGEVIAPQRLDEGDARVLELSRRVVVQRVFVLYEPALSRVLDSASVVDNGKVKVVTHARGHELLVRLAVVHNLFCQRPADDGRAGEEPIREGGNQDLEARLRARWEHRTMLRKLTCPWP